MKKFFIGIIVLILVAAIAAGVFFLGPWSRENNDPQTPNEAFSDLTKDMYGYSQDRDSDKDGLNDYDEHYVYKTSPASPDTDSDRLQDAKELELGTDPLNPDTDGDGVRDGVEIKAGTDPLTKDSRNDHERLVAVNDGAAAVDLQGNADIYEATLQEFQTTGLSNIPGVLSDVFWFYSEAEGATAVLTLALETEETEIGVYRLENDLTYTEVKSEITWEDNVAKLTAEVTNGKYFVGRMSYFNSLGDKGEQIDVFLLLDESGSLYDEMMDGAGNDPEYKRIEMCEQLLSKADSSIDFGLAFFTADYMQKVDISNDRKPLLDALNVVRNTSYEDKNNAGQFTGTFIATSIYKAIEQNFSENSDARQVLVVMTDGQTTEGKSIWDIFRDMHSIDSAIKLAEERNVTVVIVGLGNDIDVNYLTNIKQKTDGAYIYANDADALTELYDAILGAINLNYFDTDDDGKTDSIMLADTGFRPNTDGFSFRNPIVIGDGFVSTGICYGMSTFSSLYYQNRLPVSMDKMSTTDWQLWFLRYLVDAPHYEVEGYSEEDFVNAGFDMTEDGRLLYDINLSQWRTDETDSYTEYFGWDFESEFYKDHLFTQTAKDVLGNHEIIVPYTYHNEDTGIDEDYPAYILTRNPDGLSEDPYKANSLLNILMRLQVSQADRFLSDDYSWTFENNYETILTSLESSVPLVVCTSNHAMVTCRIRQDIDNPNVYHLDVYDVNTPGTGIVISGEVTTDADGNRVAVFNYGGETTLTFHNPHF